VTRNQTVAWTYLRLERSIATDYFQDSWVLGHLVKTSLRLAKLNHSGLRILVDCLGCPNVKQIYALNRPSADPVKARKAALAGRGFGPSLVDTPKLTFLHANLPAGDLGIGELLSDELRTTVRHIIHLDGSSTGRLT